MCEIDGILPTHFYARSYGTKHPARHILNFYVGFILGLILRQRGRFATLKGPGNYASPKTARRRASRNQPVSW